MLAGKPMLSKSSEENIDMLLNTDLKLRLLDIENVSIPSIQPAIPKEHKEFDFYYKLDNSDIPSYSCGVYFLEVILLCLL